MLRQLVNSKNNFPLQAQTDSDSSSGDVELNNSATEISTDSEFDHDPINRDPPKILIDDSHLRRNATRVQVRFELIKISACVLFLKNGKKEHSKHDETVFSKFTFSTSHRFSDSPKNFPFIIKRFNSQVKQAIIENGGSNRHAQMSSSRRQHQQNETKFKPLVEVDPTIILSTNKVPLKNPLPGDYLLSKTASTEGIACKKSLELKKRYLLGEAGIGSGVLKSDSASALDNKFKSFHSNISECQKLLNPANEISPSMQTFLEKIDRKNELNKSNLSIELNKEKKDQSNSEEKENRSIDSNKKKDFSETINTTLIENKIKSIDNDSRDTSIETINLITPEKPSTPIVDLTKVDIPKSTIENNKKFIENMEKSDSSKSLSESNMKIKTKLDSIFIDLTGDSPVKDRSLVETNVSFNKKYMENGKNVNSNSNVVPDIISNITSSVNGKPSESAVVQAAEESNETKDPELLENSERSRSPAHETTIEVPQLWNNSRPKNSCNDKSDNDVDTDSLSNSDDNSSNSSSSLEDIPHFILDSTTSPETQNENLVNFSNSNSSMQQPPRLEVRDTSGELMQIDSLMIIDGQYIGDPADLALYEKIPDKDSESSTNNSPGENSQTPDTPKEIVESPKDSPKKESSSDKQPSSPEKEPPKERLSYIRSSPERVAFSKEISQKPFYSRESPKKDSPEKSKIDSDITPITSLVSSPFSSLKPISKFDSKNENKIDTLKNLPLILPVDEEKKVITKPAMLLRFSDKISPINSPDTDKTPIAGGNALIPNVSDSETEMTGPGLTETELSDWTAEDAVSENFVDIEFVLNSNKGTMKRNKKKLKEQHNHIKRVPKQSQAQKGKDRETECGILKNLALDEIEFMDTGSEDSIVESTTNKAVLQNRGYVEFVENKTPTGASSYNSYSNYFKQTNFPEPAYQPSVVEAINKEVAGIDYIEQGACILNNDHDLKTPMNEPAENFDSLSRISDTKEQYDSLNVENDDDIDEDSLIIQTDSKCNESSATTASNTMAHTTTTTEESDLLTIVTSPNESLPKNGNSTTPTTPTNNTGTSNTSSSDQFKQMETQECQKQEETAELGYEEYVKSLQAKIAQISSRDSLESRRSRRKLSKSDASNNSMDKGKESVSAMSIFNREEAPIEPPPTLTKKLEEISKERVKQKDIIHDLVMDKLQAKKQMNAERRLNRSKNRSMFLGNSNNSLTSPSSTISLASTTGDIPTMSPTYGQIKNPVIPRVSTSQNKIKDDIERRHSIHTTPPKNTIVQNKENVLSDVSLNANKLNKTQSFCVYTTKQIPLKDNSENDFQFKSPQPPPRQYKTYESPTEKLRQEAKERARFKSNQELGLSPDEKIVQMRKKYNVNGSGSEFSAQTTSRLNKLERNQSDDMKFREMKMSVSKSYNDISLMKKFAMESNENITAYNNYKRGNDFVSDPNLIDTIDKEQQMHKDNTIPTTTKKPLKASRRDSERRKSLIQTVSDFFYKKKDSSSTKDLTKDSNGSPSKESGGSSMFSRFRLSPKSKENKEKAKVN